MRRDGSALVITLVALVAAALSGVLLHLLATEQLRQARVALASARAREAAAVGLALGQVGLGPAGSLPGGASWLVIRDSIAPGRVILWSTGLATRPAARLEVGAIVPVPDTTLSGSTRMPLPPSWIVMRHD